ncbi:MAG TPA: DUF4870 domain-containing protein [Longimicrobiales bacterium]|nr:DUF4870 domain-containing protein [Longimicrobiales bacterium]
MSEVQNPSGGTGLPSNVAGALSYFLGAFTGIFFLVVEKNDRFVRFHAAQSIAVSVAMIVLWVALSVLSMVLGVVPIIGWLVSILLSLGVGLGSFFLWILLMFKAYQGQEWELPVVGPQARKLLAAPAAE